MLTLRNENDLRVMNVRIDDDRLSVGLLMGAKGITRTPSLS